MTDQPRKAGDHLADAGAIIQELSEALHEAAVVLETHGSPKDSATAMGYRALLERVRLTVDRGDPWTPATRNQ